MVVKKPARKDDVEYIGIYDEVKSGSDEVKPLKPMKASEELLRPNSGENGSSRPDTATSDVLDAMRAFRVEQEEKEERAAEQDEIQHGGKSVKSAGLSGTDKAYWDAIEDSDALKHRFMRGGRALLNTAKFDAAMGVVIVINSVTIGIEAELSLEGNSDMTLLFYLEYIFLVIYTAELSLRIIVLGIKCLTNPWVQFDAVIVGVSLLEGAILAPMVYLLDINMEDSSLGLLSAFKVLRLFRLARTVRLLVQFKVLWMLVRGLLGSMKTIFFVFIIVSLIIYLFAVLGIELITKLDSPERDAVYDEYVDIYFRDVITSMMTLTWFVNCDSIASIYSVLIPYNGWLFSLYFFGFVLLVSISLMNLVTAVIVESSLAGAAEDKEVAVAAKAKKLKKLLPKIKEMFNALDHDGSGKLDYEELMNAPEALQKELGKCVPSEDMKEVFDTIDIDGSGEIELDEFINGIQQISLSMQPTEDFRQTKIVHLMKQQTKDLVREKLPAVEELVNKCEDNQSSQDKKLDAILAQLGIRTTKFVRDKKKKPPKG